MTKYKKQAFLSPGHNACAGCGQLSAAQSVMRALDESTILVNATGCLEVTTTAYPQSAWNLPWIHSLFENSASVASGIRAALNKKGDTKTKILIQAGDGATFDIGLGQLSGMWERAEDILYICYDNEAYANTGIQASGASPYGSSTTTTPSGKQSIGSTKPKKNILDIALAHNLPYVAQSVAGFPDDIERKVRKALSIKGSSYLQILSPCVPGWGIGSGEAVSMGKLAVTTGLYPLLEYENGKLITSSLRESTQLKKIEEYLKMQKRFSHLSKKEVNHIQELVDANKEKYTIK